MAQLSTTIKALFSWFNQNTNRSEQSQRSLVSTVASGANTRNAMLELYVFMPRHESLSHALADQLLKKFPDLLAIERALFFQQYNKIFSPLIKNLISGRELLEFNIEITDGYWFSIRLGSHYIEIKAYYQKKVSLSSTLLQTIYANLTGYLEQLALLQALGLIVLQSSYSDLKNDKLHDTLQQSIFSDSFYQVNQGKGFVSYHSSEGVLLVGVHDNERVQDAKMLIKNMLLLFSYEFLIDAITQRIQIFKIKTQQELVDSDILKLPDELLEAQLFMFARKNEVSVFQSQVEILTSEAKLILHNEPENFGELLQIQYLQIQETMSIKMSELQTIISNIDALIHNVAQYVVSKQNWLDTEEMKKSNRFLEMLQYIFAIEIIVSLGELFSRLWELQYPSDNYILFSYLSSFLIVGTLLVLFNTYSASIHRKRKFE